MEKDFYIEYIDGIECKLKTPFDLSFVSKYGKVFKVFDEQRSGNLCFGTEKDGQRYFVKFAGAPSVNCGDPLGLAEQLKSAAAVYQELSHPLLIRFILGETIGGGYAAVFEWTAAVCAGRDYPEARARFMALPQESRVKVFEDIMTFHAHTAEKGYVAVDFYDGSIMYDFEQNKTVICDIDLYQKTPYTGELGRWDSADELAQFFSREELTQGAVLDEITTVHTMGQTAFDLFADSNRSPEAWTLSPETYAVIKRAVSSERNQR